MNRRATLGGFVGFFLIGLTFSTFGPALPALRLIFHIDLATSSLIIGATGAGAAAGTLLAALLSRALDMRIRLMLSTALMATGTLVIGVAPTWPVMVAGAFCFGAGSGGIAGIYQILFAHSFGNRSGTMLSLVNGAFGVGSISGPLILGLLPENLLRPRFVVESALILLSLALVAGAPKRIAHLQEKLDGTRTNNRPVILFGVAMFFTFGLEQSVGGWETTYLHFRGVPTEAAISATALFWGTYTFIRIAGAGLVERIGPNRIPAAAFALTAFFVLVAALWQRFGFIDYALAGASIGLIVPSVLAWFARSTSVSDGAGTLVIAIGNMGTMSLPVLVGAVSGFAGLASIPFTCAALAAIAAGVCLVLRRA